MHKTRLAIISSLLIISAIAWILSISQPDMMEAMTTYNPVAITVFTVTWTAGMAAMMFPAVTPMVLLYNTIIAGNNNQSSLSLQDQPPRISILSFRVVLFVACYLLVWALTGIALLLGWSVVMNAALISASNSQLAATVYGILLIIAGVYQFTPLKRKCIGYCESPMGFFMRRWKNGTFGAVRMGVWHGFYCLGCCWPYFMLMVALGWMNILWMGLFAGVIFGEKMWKKGIWIARAAGIGLAILGVFALAGMATPLLPSSASMHVQSSAANGQTVLDSAHNSTKSTPSDMTLMQNNASQANRPMTMN